jgi:hypothetical protein
MEIKTDTPKTSIPVEDEGGVWVSIKSGDGQISGKSCIGIGEKIFKIPREGASLGLGMELKGKTVQISTSVSKTNGYSSKASLTYVFKQNGKEQVVEFKKEIGNDIQNYIDEFNFI